VNTYLRNVWYVAAWAAELPAGQLLARTLLDEPVVFYRQSDGAVAALADRCPHRFAPLSMGRLSACGTSLECAYHGLRFDGRGACVHNPHGDGAIPKAATVRAYPVVERYSALWIWMGDPDRADASRIPDFPFNDPVRWAVGTGHMVVDGGYELEIDNILDLSHIEFMHPLFSSEAVRRAKVECVQDGETVWCKRFMANDTEAPDFIREGFQVPKGVPIDRWLDVRWNAPANMALWAGGVASGTPPEQGGVVHQAHCFTPASRHRTHYFYSIAFPRAMGSMAEELAQQNIGLLREPFEQEDKPVIEAVARRMGDADFWSLKPVLLSGDAAAVRARRLLKQMIETEQASAP
jgi:vanillate O-demethylase monooxygenase subunit